MKQFWINIATFVAKTAIAIAILGVAFHTSILPVPYTVAAAAV